MARSERDWRVTEVVTTKMNADYLVANVVAQLVVEAIRLYREEWNLGLGLYEGFQTEVRKIKRVGLSLKEGCPNIDTQVLVYMAKLRRCYDAYENQAISLSRQTMATVCHLGGEETKSVTWNKLSNKMCLQDIQVKDEVLWSTPKLLDVLQQSQTCTSTLLRRTPLAVLTMPTLKISHTDLDYESRRNRTCVPVDNDDNDTACSTTDSEPVTIPQTNLGEINLSASYQITNLSHGQTDTNMFVERKHHDCSWDAKSCTFVHKNLIRTATHLHRVYIHENSGLLRFHDLVKHQPTPGAYAFSYELPEHIKEQTATPSLISLRDGIQKTASSERLPNLIRLKLASRIAHALSELHEAGLLHRNLRKRSVIFFSTLPDPTPTQIPWTEPYLVNFDFPRPTREQTSYNFGRDLESDISRHPACQGRPNESFSEHHDVYALGVLLLEIGLWISAADVYTGENAGVPAGKTTSPVRILNRLKRAADQTLPLFMGRPYADLVLACFTGAYPGRDDGAKVSAAFVAMSIDRMECDVVNDQYTYRA